MIDGNLEEFVKLVLYGSELGFWYDGKKYFLQGWHKNGRYVLCLDTWESLSDGYLWSREHLDRDRLAEEFLAAPLFNGKSFWEVEKEITWVDC